MARTFGYARVSSQSQCLSRQLIALEDFGVERRHIFADKASGSNFYRPEWTRLMQDLRMGDVLVVKSIDRLGRNYNDILDVWRLLTREMGVAIVVLDMPLLDTRQSREGITGILIADIVLQLLSYVAEVERENNRQRQAEGIAAAKARGVRFGRPRKERPEGYAAVRDLVVAGGLTRREAARTLGVSAGTLVKWLREDGMAPQAK